MKKTFYIFISCLFVFFCCHKQLKLPSIKALPMDSSITIILGTSGLLTDSCIPNCWPRDFSNKKPADKYLAYIQQNFYKRDTTNRKSFEKLKTIFPEVDSSFYSIIDEATINYDSMTNGETIKVEDIRLLDNRRVKFGLTNGLKGKLNDNELGYLMISPIFMNLQGDKGVFFYQLNAEFMTSWLICIQKKAGKWVAVSRSRLAIS